MPLPFTQSGVSFTPSRDIPPLHNKVALVTGGNSGLGKQSIIELATHQPAQIWLAARDLNRAEASMMDIKKQVPEARIKLLQLDLTSFESIKEASAIFLRSETRLDILMLNAGIMATPEGTTKNGYEVQFGTNHMGHALLTRLLLPILKETSSLSNTDVRIIILSSNGHRLAPDRGILFNTLKDGAGNSLLSTWARYGQSKLANILYAKELSTRYQWLKVISVHPGVVNTDLSKSWANSNAFIRLIRPVAMPFAKLAMTTVTEGVKNQLWAATSPEATSGEYYEPIGIAGRGSKATTDSQLAQKLWDWTEEELNKAL